MSEQRSDTDDLSLAERMDGVEIAKKLKNFYRITDTQIQNSNLLTRLLNWLREFCFVPYHTTRFWFEERGERYFRGYNETEFFQQFGNAFDAMGDHPAADSRFFSISRQRRISVKEDLIRAHFTQNNQ